MPPGKGTRHWWSCCSRTMPACTQSSVCSGATPPSLGHTRWYGAIIMCLKRIDIICIYAFHYFRIPKLCMHRHRHTRARACVRALRACNFVACVRFCPHTCAEACCFFCTYLVCALLGFCVCAATCVQTYTRGKPRNASMTHVACACACPCLCHCVSVPLCRQCRHRARPH